jgi:hypothetical protein
MSGDMSVIRSALSITINRGPRQESGSSPGVSVHRNALISQAAFWEDECSPNLSGYAIEASQSSWHGSPGIFGAVIRPYNEVCEMIARLCNQGSAQMTAISEALLKAAGNYDAVEAQNTGLASGIQP